MIPIHVPLLNPNDTEVLLADLNVAQGQHVFRGDILCTLETTKSTHELPAEEEGFIVGLRYSSGQTIPVGEVLFYLADAPDAVPEQIGAETNIADDKPEQLRITQPALALARENNLDLASLPIGLLVTESVIRDILANGKMAPSAPPNFDAQSIVIYGGSGHGKALIDLIRAMHTYDISGIVDDSIPTGTMVMDLPVLGGACMLGDLYAQGLRLAVNAVGGISDIRSRIYVFNQLAQAGFVCPILIHPTAWVEAGAHLSPGVQIFPFAYIGSEAEIGNGCIINTAAIVSHDCRIGDYANIAPGAALAGAVEVGEGVLIGMRVTVNLQVKIGAYAKIGNGATVKGDVPAGGIVRAGTTWPKDN